MERDKTAVVDRKIRLLMVAVAGLTSIVIILLVFTLAKPTESATTPGTCLPTAKGGTGCFDIEFLNKIYPIGAIYTSTSDVNPSTYLGGVWEEFGGGRTLVGVDAAQVEFDTVGESGGEKTHTLTTNEIPPLTTYAAANTTGGNSAYISNWNGYTGSGVSNVPIGQTKLSGALAHNNLQPYITVYFWKRTS